MRSAGRWAGLGAPALVTAGLLVSPSAAPVASADNCPDAEVVFARGTNEPPGLGRVGNAFVGSLRQQTGGMNIRTYGVNYAADTLQVHGGDGANDAISHVKSTVSSCPNTKIVLGGYSQGASVIDIVAGVPIGGINWGSLLPPEYANNVAAVVTFGNVADRAGGALPVQSAMLGSKAIDLCNPNDPICHAGQGNEWRGTHRGLHPRVHDSGSGFRCVQAFGWDRPGGARIWAVGALVRPADAGVRPRRRPGTARRRRPGYGPVTPWYGPQTPGYGPQTPGYGPQTPVRPADAGVQPADAGVWPVDTRIRSAGLACPPSPVGLGGSLTDGGRDSYQSLHWPAPGSREDRRLSELRLLAAVRRSIREHGGEPSSRQVVPGTWQLLAVDRHGPRAGSAEAELASMPTPGRRTAMRRSDRAVEAIARRAP